jgi:hypothetical protein
LRLPQAHAGVRGRQAPNLQQMTADLGKV